MVIEIIIAIIAISLVTFTFLFNFKQSKKGCSSCSSCQEKDHCKKQNTKSEKEILESTKNHPKN